MLKRGAHVTVTRTVDLSFFFSSLFSHAEKFWVKSAFNEERVAAALDWVWLSLMVRKCSFRQGGAMKDAMPFGNFSLNPLTYEEWHQPVLWHFVVLQNLAHEISKQNEIDGESMWFLTRHDHAYGHKLILLTKMNANITLEFSQYISTVVFDELGNPGNETRKSFMFHNLIKWPDVRFFTHKNICTVQTPEVLMSSYPDIHFWMFRIIITFSGLHATYSINFI